MSRGKGKRTLVLVEAAKEILDEIAPATVRAVCYQLFIRGLIPNMGKSATNSVSRLLTQAREEGDVDWDSIVDESREAERAAMWSSPSALIRAAVNQYRRDYWQDQDYRVEVWSEKGTVRGTLSPVLDEYGVTFRVMHGYASATVVNNIADLTNGSDKPLVALYVGDHDPSGLHMSDVDLPRRLIYYGADGLELKRIALVRSDLRGLPSFDVESKRSDPRYRWYRQNVKTRCYELDAMSPPLLRERVEAHIRTYIDLPKWKHARMVEAAEVESMRDFHKSWQALISSTGPKP